MSRAIALIALASSGCGRLGFDVVDLGDDGPNGDGSIADTAPPCLGTTHLLVDNFDDNTLDAAKWGKAYDGGMVHHAEANGMLEIQLGVGVTFDYAGYVSTTLYDYADDRVFAEVVNPNTQVVGSTLLLLELTEDHADGPSVEYDAGNVVMRRRAANVIMDLATLPYDPVAHRWWQLREHAGRTYWETSPDGRTWTTHHDEPSAADTHGFITLAAGYDGQAASQADTVRFDNVNGGGSPPLCP